MLKQGPTMSKSDTMRTPAEKSVPPAYGENIKRSKGTSITYSNGLGLIDSLAEAHPGDESCRHGH